MSDKKAFDIANKLLGMIQHTVGRGPDFWTPEVKRRWWDWLVEEITAYKEGPEIARNIVALKHVEDDRDAWKAKAEKLAGALQFIINTSFDDKSTKTAKEALAEFEK